MDQPRTKHFPLFNSVMKDDPYHLCFRHITYAYRLVSQGRPHLPSSYWQLRCIFISLILSTRNHSTQCVHGNKWFVIDVLFPLIDSGYTELFIIVTQQKHKKYNRKILHCKNTEMAKRIRVQRGILSYHIIHITFSSYFLILLFYMLLLITPLLA